MPSVEYHVHNMPVIEYVTTVKHKSELKKNIAHDKRIWSRGKLDETSNETETNQKKVQKSSAILFSLSEWFVEEGEIQLNSFNSQNNLFCSRDLFQILSMDCSGNYVLSKLQILISKQNVIRIVEMLLNFKLKGKLTERKKELSSWMRFVFCFVFFNVSVWERVKICLLQRL